GGSRADLLVGGHEPDEQRGAAHEADGQREERASADAIAHPAQHHAAHGPREKSQCEHAEGQHVLRRDARFREELAADMAGEVAALEGVAEEPREHGAQRGLRRPFRSRTVHGAWRSDTGTRPRRPGYSFPRTSRYTSSVRSRDPDSSDSSLLRRSVT